MSHVQAARVFISFAGAAILPAAIGIYGLDFLPGQLA
jgi:hypothetical protein